MFELVYELFDVNGVKVSEVKRVILDAGSNLDHFQSFFKAEGATEPLTCGIGLKKVAGEQKQFNAERGSLVIWEKMEENQGMQGVALIVDPKTFTKQAEDKKNNLLLVKVGPDGNLSYWAGFGWDKSGQFADSDTWSAYVDHFAQGVASPIQVAVSAE